MSTLDTNCLLHRGFFVLAIALTFATLSPSAFAVSQPVPGKWACIGQGVFGTASSGVTSSSVENMRFTTDAKGNLTSGIFIITSGGFEPQLSGQTCRFPLNGGGYSVGTGNGIGRLDLFGDVTPSDEDGSFNCGSLFGPLLSLHLNILVTKGGNHIFFSGAENENGLSLTDGDEIPISGECSKQ